MANSNFTYQGTDLDSLLLPQSVVWQPGERRSIWSWGNTTSSPTQIGSAYNWADFSVSSHYLGIQTDGTLWAWGPGNSSGQLGLNDQNAATVPTKVGSLTNWSKVFAGPSSSYAIKTDGTLWVWGNNVDGRLGLNDRTDRSSPVQLGSLTNWKSVSSNIDVSFGGGPVIAVKTDGTLWGWGGNYQGQLGLNDRNHRSSPVQIGSLNTWKTAVSGGPNSAAISNNGTLWIWGYNYGSLGVSGPYYSSPVQVGALTTWNHVSIDYGNLAVIKTDGTLWVCGKGYFGRLGLGNTTDISTLTQVGTLTNWDKIIVGSSRSNLALKTDGTLWSWGRNSYGQLGLGDTTHRSSPVQIGSLTSWTLITSAAYSARIPGALQIR